MVKPLEQAVTSLESVIEKLVRLHNELLGLLQRKHNSLREGQAQAMIELCGLENEKVQAIGDLEKQRLELVGRLTLMVDPAAPEPLRLGELAARLPDPARGRLVVLRQRLRDQLLKVQSQTSVARRATESLKKHMQGLVQTIGALSTGASTYGDRGSAPGATAAVRTVNMTA